ncbi:hypothetical protein JTE90_014970 [Oedothorax gibbosus]|uniref:Uncharacterized protein n=1 Tax=Oedothorax gibbosus TaxID=931172 RepID=A0AAV6UYU3_9ARAC|nr:hypothetical protein JTE90_014970 [Oedothorax gibbosus]
MAVSYFWRHAFNPVCNGTISYCWRHAFNPFYKDSVAHCGRHVFNPFYYNGCLLLLAACFQLVLQWLSLFVLA